MCYLKDLNLKTTYRSGTDNLLTDFYHPALSRAKIYQRAVGYFTSKSLAHAARGVAALLKNDGSIQLIASPHLTDDDIDALNSGYGSREERLQALVSEKFDLDDCDWVSKRLEVLSYLVSQNKMDVKIAFRVDKYGRHTNGLYHEKIGVIHDAQSEYISFRGSANETEGGLITNFESIPVHWSWDDSQGRAAEIAEYFKKLWDDRTPGLKVLPFTDCARDLLEPYKPAYTPSIEQEKEEEFASIKPDGKSPSQPDGPCIPENIKLRDYQESVIDAWIANNGRGIYALATGTGKTVTALATATRLRYGGKLQAILVICPYRNLVTQWSTELKKFGVEAICAFQSRSTWHAKLTGELARPRSNKDAVLTVVTTFTTFGSEAFQALLNSFPRKTLLIADEAHHVGSNSLSDLVPKPDRGFPYRLALSATPERYQDEEGTKKIIDLFGPILEPRIGVAEAIEMGALCSYFYHPTFIELDEYESERYRELTSRAAKLISMQKNESTNAELRKILRDRTKFIAGVKGRFDFLKWYVENNEIRRTLIYCGAGSVDLEGTDSSEAIKQVDQIVDLLGNELGIRVAKYTAETRPNARKAIVRQLVEEELQAIVAINCLDEGVDIPCIESAILLTSGEDPRQFIQRRGRVLRTFVGKKHATIYDLIVLPAKRIGEASIGERNIVEKEIIRYLEFARTAKNRAEVEKRLLPLQEEYGLLHL